jgi:dihydroneopterin aldolase
MDVVTVTVHKPEAPIGGKFADVGITMTRRQADPT